MNSNDLNILVDRLNLAIRTHKIIIDDIIISSSNAFFRHTFTDEGNKLHELRSLSKYIVSLCFGHLLYNNDINKLFDITTPVWPVLLPKVLKYNKGLLPFINVINVEKLLIQSAGYNNPNLLMSGYMSVNSEHYLDLLANHPIDFFPGTKFVYSNASYFLLSAFYQELYGESIYEYAKKNIFSPLNILESEWSSYGDYCAGATGLKMFSKDFHKIAKLSITDGIYKNKSVIPSNYIKEMLSGKITVPQNYNSSFFTPKQYGYAFWCTDDSIKYISGANGQYFIIKEPENICITILSNTQSISYVLKIIDNWLKTL